MQTVIYLLLSINQGFNCCQEGYTSCSFSYCYIGQPSNQLLILTVPSHSLGSIPVSCLWAQAVTSKVCSVSCLATL